MKRWDVKVDNTPEPPKVLASGVHMAYVKDMLRKRILFIDDEDLVREAISELLTDMDYEVRVEETGHAGMKAFTEHPEEFDLVLTDLMMLDMMGDAIAERISSIRPDVPIVVMTGTPDNLPRDKAKAAGVCKVVGKPLTKAELDAELRGALSHDCLGTFSRR
jgi:CheY-like chemotaxis protein